MLNLLLNVSHEIVKVNLVYQIDQPEFLFSLTVPSQTAEIFLKRLLTEKPFAKERNKERLQKRTRERYQDLSEDDKNKK